MMTMRLSVVACLVLTAPLLAGCELLQQPSPLTKLDGPPVLPEPRSTYLDLGRQYLRAGEVDLAKRAFLRSLRLEGTTAAALTGVGLAAERQGLLTEARRYFERAKIKAPESVLAHNNLGAVLYAMGDYHAAKQAFQAAFALSSGNSQIATQNLALSELAIRRVRNENVPVAENPVTVRREGTHEYRILMPAEKETSG